MKSGEKDIQTPNYNKITTKEKMLKGLRALGGLLFTLFQIWLIIYLYSEFSWRGIGYMILVMLFIIVVLRWKQYKFIVWHMFKMIFGKYPNEFEKGELKKMKFRLVVKHDKSNVGSNKKN